MAVPAPVALHVRAKRYLCAVDPGYVVGLSPSKRRRLEVQGGPLDAVEVGVFERIDEHAAATVLQLWDDGAADPRWVTRELEDHRPLPVDLIRTHHPAP